MATNCCAPPTSSPTVSGTTAIDKRFDDDTVSEETALSPADVTVITLVPWPTDRARPLPLIDNTFVGTADQLATLVRF